VWGVSHADLVFFISRVLRILDGSMVSGVCLVFGDMLGLYHVDWVFCFDVWEWIWGPGIELPQDPFWEYKKPRERRGWCPIGAPAADIAKGGASLVPNADTGERGFRLVEDLGVD
jgi:hypothetical protein